MAAWQKYMQEQTRNIYSRGRNTLAVSRKKYGH